MESTKLEIDKLIGGQYVNKVTSRIARSLLSVLYILLALFGNGYKQRLFLDLPRRHGDMDQKFVEA